MPRSWQNTRHQWKMKPSKPAVISIEPTLQVRVETVTNKCASSLHPRRTLLRWRFNHGSVQGKPQCFIKPVVLA